MFSNSLMTDRTAQTLPNGTSLLLPVGVIARLLGAGNSMI